jgi:predicted ATPase
MSDAQIPKRTLLQWDEDHIRALISEPETLLGEEPWASWIVQQGGLAAVHASLRNLPLSEKQRKTLNALISEPGASLQRYALLMSVSVATYVRYRASLIKTLLTILNARLLDKPQGATGESGRKRANANTNVPHPLTPLIGRQRELDAIYKIFFRDGANLLTITGPGGMGKTRLAMQAAAEMLDNFNDGVFFVPLAVIVDPELVPTTIARAMELKTGENQPAAETLKAYLKDKQILLVVDNFEQVLPAAALLNELLSVAPQLKILVTSRAVLHLYGEHELNVPPLQVPDLKQLPSPDALAQSPAVALFLNRAQSVKSDFVLTPENAPQVAEICVYLEGIPLALEIAAARIKLFSPQALLTGLRHRPTLLAQKSSEMAPRHQTLRDAIAWSYNLLDPHERALYAQLGVFVGGCSLEAAEAVCLLPGSDSEFPAPMLEVLASLVDKSMLQARVRDTSETRFTMLETLREYALEQLEAGQPLGEAQRRHLDYYLALIESIEPGPKEPNLLTWMKRLEEEHDNIRAALRAALDADDTDSALRISGSIWRFWQIHGHAIEGGKWFDEILARPAGKASIFRAKALWGAGWLAMVRGALDQALAYFEEGASISRELGDRRYLGLALHGIGAVARGQGDFARSRSAFEESFPLFQALNSPEDVAWTYEHLGVTALEQGDFAQAVSHLSSGLALFEELDQRWPRAEALTFLGHAALQQEDFLLARRHYQAALALYEELEDKPNVAIINSYLGAVLFGEGDIARAVVLYKQNLKKSQEMKDYWGMVWGIERLADAAEKMEQAERAVRLWGAADSLRRIAGVLWHPGFHTYYSERRFAGLRSQLGDGRWETLRAEGRVLTLEDAIVMSLGVPDQVE